MITIAALNDLRIAKRITLKEIAVVLDISECYCSLLLSGKRRMSLDNAQKLAKLMDKSIDEIFLLYFSSKNENKTADIP